MEKVSKTLKEILENASGIFDLNNFYSHDMQYWEDDGNISLSVSHSCHKITGYSTDEFLSNPKLFESIIFYDDLEIWKDRCKQIHIDDVGGIQFRIKHKSGKIVWLEHDAQKLFNTEGGFIGIRSSNRDITKQKLAEEIIGKSASVLFLWKNEDGFPVEFVSSNVKNIFGYTFEEFISGSVTYNDLIHPECSERVSSEINQNIKNKDQDFIHEPYRVITKDGKVIWVSDSTVVKEDANGIITHFHGIVTDITEQKETEEALKASEQRFSSSQEAANIGSWELDVESGKLFWSAQIEPLFGLKKGEFKGTYETFINCIHPEDRDKVKNAVKASIDDNKPYKIEHRVVSTDGTIRWMLEQGRIKKDENNSIKMFGTVRDITERKTLFTKLKQSEQQFKSLVEFSPNGICIHSHGKIVYANPMAIAMIGGSASKDYIGLDIKQLIHPESMDEVLRQMSDVSKGLGRRSFFEIKALRLNGTTFAASVASTIINYKGESATQTVFYDITKTKKAQDDLRKSEEIYRSVFNQSPLGILHFDTEGRITDCNDELAKILGVSKEALIGLNMLSELKDENIILAVKNSLINGSSYYEDYYTSVTSGHTLPVIVRFNAVYADDNSISGGVGLVEDISERKRNEKLQKALFDISEEASRKTSMKEHYAKFHKIIETLMPAENIYLAMYNSETDLISFPYHVDKYDSAPKPRQFGNGLTEYILRNKKSQIITGEQDKELQAKGEVQLTGKFSKVWVGIYLEFEGIYKGVLVIQDYKNEDVYSENELKVLQFVSAQIVKVLDKQYANRRLRESIKELSEAKKELELINKNKDRFFSIIAHDLKSPFNTLLGVSEMISGDMDDMSMREVKEISSVIHSSTQNLFKLIENLLSWSRLQMGSFKIEPVKLEIIEAANSVLEILTITANEKDISIQNNLENVKVFADEECVKTVLRNLISNAIKFTKRHGRINLISKTSDRFIEITISDNGIGIKPNVLKNIFSITDKTSQIGTENESGTGLGLILCKDLIEKNSGEIWVESEYGKGSRFTFTLPRG